MFVRDAAICRNVLLAMHVCPPLRETQGVRSALPVLVQMASQSSQTILVDEMYDKILPLNYLARLYQDLWMRDPINNTETLSSAILFFSPSVNLSSLTPLMPSSIQRVHVPRSV